MYIPSNSISVEDAARIIGISLINLRKSLRAGKIKGIKIKKCWYVDIDSVKDYINRNGSQNSAEVEINGEHAIRLEDFAQKRGLENTKELVNNGTFVVVRLNNRYYITDSEARRYDKRFEEYCGKRIISLESAEELLNCDERQIKLWISDGYLETVTVENREFVFADTLKRFEKQREAGLDFLSIPK